MKLSLALSATILIFASTANAEVVQDKIQELFSQGFTHFEITRGATRSKIEGYSSDGTKIELFLNNSTGDVLSQEIEELNEDDRQNVISSIEARHDEHEAEEEDRRGRGRGRGEDDEDRDEDKFHEDEDDGQGRGRGRGRGGDDDDDHSDGSGHHDDSHDDDYDDGGHDDDGENDDGGHDDGGHDDD